MTELESTGPLADVSASPTWTRFRTTQRLRKEDLPAARPAVVAAQSQCLDPDCLVFINESAAPANAVVNAMSIEAATTGPALHAFLKVGSLPESFASASRTPSP